MSVVWVLEQAVLLGLLFALVIFFIVLQLGRYHIFSRPRFIPHCFTFFSKTESAPEILWPSLISVPSTWLVGWLRWSGYARIRSWRKIMAVAAIIGLIAIGASWWTLLLLMFVAFILFIVWLAWRISTRRRNFVRQLPEALDALVQALRSGYDMTAALALVERESITPVREIFTALTRAEQYRLSLTEAVRLLEDQLTLPEWNLVAEAIQLQRTLGGNIVPVLHEVATTLREKIRIDLEVHSLTASSRLSGLIIAALAPLSLIAFMIFSPSYITILTQSTLGHLLLLIAGLLEVFGFLIIWRLVQVDY